MIMTNSTGYYRVYKQRVGNGGDRFTYRYQYTEEGKRRTISRNSIELLEDAVRDQGLEWRITDYEKAYADVDDDWVFPLAHPPKPSDYVK